MSSYIEVPEQFSHVLPDGSTFTIDNNVRQQAGLPPIVAWPEGYVYICSKEEPDKGEFHPGLKMIQDEHEEAMRGWRERLAAL